MSLASTFLAALLFVILFRLEEPSKADVAPPPAPSSIEEGIKGEEATSTNALAIRAVDGDTIEVKIDGEKDNVKVRLLGVNTPESVDPRRPVECFGKEASKHTASLVDGKRVRLEADPQADEVDRYGRLLRNIILEDGTDLNAALVRDGYAHAYLDFPLNKQRKVELKRLETEAMAAQVGLWNPLTCSAN